MAYSVMAGLLAIFCVAVPGANLPLRHVTAFIPVFATAMAIVDLTTAALIFAQYWVARWFWLLVLGCGFLFTGLVAIPYGLTFPEGFAPAGLLGAGTQTAAQLSLCSRIVAPGMLILALVVREARWTPSLCQRSPGWALLLGIALICASVGGLTWATVASDRILPWIYVNSLQSNLELLLPILALTAIPFGLLLIRGRSVLDLWLTVMCCAWLFDLSLVILAESRYSVGWYTARSFQVAAVFFVLLLLLSEATALYANLARASVLRRGAYHARQIAMDVMAASLAHEIKQPLTGLLINADACRRQLSAAGPGLEDLQDTFADIVADGRRISDIIGSVRTMFQQSAHDRQRLDVNKVVRDALATVDLDLQRQGVSVKTELDDGLPPVLGDSGQLHQVFLNLITNALEAMAAMPDGPSTLKVTSAMEPGSSDIAIIVEDTGVGLPDKYSTRIAEPFFSTKATGTGVGLTICRVILKAHGGSLRFHANKPRGTVARVTMPNAGHEYATP